MFGSCNTEHSLHISTFTLCEFKGPGSLKKKLWEEMGIGVKESNITSEIF